MSADTKLSMWNTRTLWIILCCHAAMALGTALGGWRIVKTMGMKITKLKPVGGFCAETSGAITLALATFWGVPVSTTHTITALLVVVSRVGLQAIVLLMVDDVALQRVLTASGAAVGVGVAVGEGFGVPATVGVFVGAGVSVGMTGNGVSVGEGSGVNVGAGVAVGRTSEK